jgi:hypothetical protein
MLLGAAPVIARAPGHIKQHMAERPALALSHRPPLPVPWRINRPYGHGLSVIQPCAHVGLDPPVPLAPP